MSKELKSFKLTEGDSENQPLLCPNDTIYYEPISKIMHDMAYKFVVVQVGNNKEIRRLEPFTFSKKDTDIYKLNITCPDKDKDLEQLCEYSMPFIALQKSGLIVGVVKEIKRDIYNPEYLELHKYYTKTFKEKQWNTFINIIKAF